MLTRSAGRPRRLPPSRPSKPRFRPLPYPHHLEEVRRLARPQRPPTRSVVISARRIVDDSHADHFTTHRQPSIHAAAQRGDVSVIDALVKAGRASVDDRDDQNVTPLHWARSVGRTRSGSAWVLIVPTRTDTTPPTMTWMCSVSMLRCVHQLQYDLDTGPAPLPRVAG